MGTCQGNALMLIKRGLDLIIAGSGLLLGTPLFVLAMVAIVGESPGNPIYRQRRIGHMVTSV
jgi:lipopolysaccharide/colanic/teichoic acid biosynthesis glycosyltransferase